MQSVTRSIEFTTKDESVTKSATKILSYLTLAVLHELQGQENMWEKACYVYTRTKGIFQFFRRMKA